MKIAEQGLNLRGQSLQLGKDKFNWQQTKNSTADMLKEAILNKKYGQK